MVAVPIVVIVLLGTTEPAQIRIFGYAYHFASKLPALTGLSAMFLLFWWQYRVLKRTDIQALFKRSLQN